MAMMMVREREREREREKSSAHSLLLSSHAGRSKQGHTCAKTGMVKCSNAGLRLKMKREEPALYMGETSAGSQCRPGLDNVSIIARMKA